MQIKNKGKIAYVLQTISIVPLLLFGVVILILGTHWFTKAMHQEVETELAGIAMNVITLFDISAPGDYHLQADTSSLLYKGDTNLSGDYSLIDRIKDNTGLDITLFYADTRILTTICNSDGERIVGTKAGDKIIADVYETGESHFYSDALINNSSYFAFYTPLYNSNNSVVGMVFVGKPSDRVRTAIRHSIYPLVIADAIAMIIISICIFIYMKNFASSLMRIDIFLLDVSSGNLNATLPSSITRRSDELGDIGRLALTMQTSLRNMIEKDALTQILNRHCADRKLHQVIEKSRYSKVPFSLAIGDIDFFKKVNDTYGHNCGDLVLQNVARIIRQHMHSLGFAARWGGEEFLLVFDHSDLPEAVISLEHLLSDIRTMDSNYEGQTIKITMTFGVTAGDAIDLKELVRMADDKLYEGKSAGRDRIVS